MSGLSTPTLQPHPYTGRSVLMVDWRACLDDPAPTAAARARGQKVYVTGPRSEFGDEISLHGLDATGYGMPETWDEIMSALGTGDRGGLIYHRGTGALPRFLSNGNVGFYVDRQTIDAVASLDSSMELPTSSYEKMHASESALERGDSVQLRGLFCAHVEDVNIARIGNSFVDVKIVAAAMRAGATQARPAGELDSIMLDGIGIMMPMRVPDDTAAKYEAAKVEAGR